MTSNLFNVTPQVQGPSLEDLGLSMSTDPNQKVMLQQFNQMSGIDLSKMTTFDPSKTDIPKVGQAFSTSAAQQDVRTGTSLNAQTAGEIQQVKQTVQKIESAIGPQNGKGQTSGNLSGPAADSTKSSIGLGTVARIGFTVARTAAITVAAGPAASALSEIASVAKKMGSKRAAQSYADGEYRRSATMAAPDQNSIRAQMAQEARPAMLEAKHHLGKGPLGLEIRHDPSEVAANVETWQGFIGQIKGSIEVSEANLQDANEHVQEIQAALNTQHEKGVVAGKDTINNVLENDNAGPENIRGGVAFNAIA